MSTRGFVGVVLDNKVRISYNHSDSYPTWLGLRVFETVNGWMAAQRSDTEFMAGVRARIENMRYLHQEEKVTVDGTEAEAYEAFRGDQGDVAAMLAHGVMVLAGDTWPHDSLFCEWGYLIDFDTWAVEVYQGFQKPDAMRAGRWKDAEGTTDGYGPVRLVSRVNMSLLADTDDRMRAELVDALNNIDADVPVPGYFRDVRSWIYFATAHHAEVAAAAAAAAAE